MCKAAEGARKQQVVASIVIKGISNVRVEQGLYCEYSCRREERRHPSCNLYYLYMFKMKINTIQQMIKLLEVLCGLLCLGDSTGLSIIF